MSRTGLKSRRNPRPPLGVVSPRGRSSSEPQSPPGQKAQKLRMLPPEADEDRGWLRRPPKERSLRRQLHDRRPVPRQQPFRNNQADRRPIFFFCPLLASPEPPQKRTPVRTPSLHRHSRIRGTSKRRHNRDARNPTSACKGLRKRPSSGRPLAQRACAGQRPLGKGVCAPNPPRQRAGFWFSLIVAEADGGRKVREKLCSEAPDLLVKATRPYFHGDL